MDPLKKVHEFSSRHSMFDSASGLVLAVSGGPDSVALLDIMVRLVREDREHRYAVGRVNNAPNSITGDAPVLKDSVPSRLRLVVAHFDHKLRGEESLEDACFVASLARRYGLEVEVGGADVRKQAGLERRGVEEVARELRYAFLLRVAGTVGADRIATGHNLTDQAETLLMRLIRGSGTHGLAAMRPVSPVPSRGTQVAETGDGATAQTNRLRVNDSPENWTTESGRVYERLDSVAAAAPSLLVRPMLCLSREEIERYCHNRGLEFRIDASNFSHDYTRNRIRHTILSDLRSINPKVEQALAGASELLAEDDRALDLIADSALNGALPSETERAIFASTKAYPYRVGPFVRQESAIMRRMIIRAANLCSEAAQLGMTNVLAVERLIREGRTGKHIVVPGGISVWRDGGLVVFGYDGDASYEIELNENAREVEAGGFVISIERGLQFHTLRQLIDDAREQNRSGSNNWMSAIVDDGKVPASLLVRTRRKGEVALVYGRRSVKKLKILMINHRIPVSRRPAWPVVASVDGRYLWSPELPPAIEFCACNETRSLAVLRARISQPETGEPAT